MAQIDKHAPETFCWVELETSNLMVADADLQGAVFSRFSNVK